MTAITSKRSENVDLRRASNRRASNRRASNRRALTLIEIMASILVLSVGLVGVLAAIPFGGMRLAQMNEADNSSAMGRNAVRVMKFNGWANPENWLLQDQNNNGSMLSVHNLALFSDGSLNLTYPFFVDPLGKTAEASSPEFYDYKPDGGFEVFFTRVSPKYDLPSGYWKARYEREFYLQDVVNGYASYEDETATRPRVETELNSVMIANPQNKLVGSDEIDSFSGRHSWLATVSPKSSFEPFYHCSRSSVVAADYQVAVFQDRIPNDEKVFTATLDGSGYQGGVVTVDLTTTLTSPALSSFYRESEKDADSVSRARIVDQLETTRYIMLFGRDDMPEDGNYRAFAKWYQIANYSVVGRDGNGVPTTVRMNLIGENTPLGWANGLKISALFFPGVVGVYSGTATF